MTKPGDKRGFLLPQPVLKGLQKGWSSFVWLISIILPVSFATALLIYFKIIYQLDFLLKPLMDWIGLPAHAALVILLGLFTGIYGTVGALSVAEFSMEHMTLIAIFSLICHNIIQESMVQGKSGLNAFYAGLFRLVAAFAVTFICSKIMGVKAGASSLSGYALAVGGEAGTLMNALWDWGRSVCKLSLQIFCIVMPLMVVLEAAKSGAFVERLTQLLYPLLRLIGLDRSTGVLWLTAIVFGLAYGSAVIVEEVQQKNISAQDLKRLHLSIGINHSMIEDPALFLPLGLPVFWLWVPRLVVSIGVAWVHRIICAARSHHA